MKRPFYKAKAPKAKPSDRPGFGARRRASELFEWVLHKQRPLDEALEAGDALSDQDRALARQIASTALRRHGQIEKLLAERLPKGLPPGLPRLHSALVTGVAQILFLDVPDHAAVDLAVSLVEHDRKAAGLKGLANATLRAIARDKAAIIAALDALDALPKWLRQSWVRAYGEKAARAMAAACLVEPPLDLTVKSDAAGWADRLGGSVTPTGSVRLIADRPVPMLEGFGDGVWWVQDAAAALPARLFGDVAGLGVADLCAAPGGKTAQLAAMGAQVTAVDRSERRLERLHENMERLGLQVTVVVADASTMKGAFDAVLIDAPCSATGTLRGHPDVGLTKRAEDVAALAKLQARLIDHAVTLTKPGGTIVYCTCSLEPEEGEAQVPSALERNDALALVPIKADELPGLEGFITAEGYLRTLPSHWPHENPRLAGLSGFFAARFKRI